jgi:hypothetical protein
MSGTGARLYSFTTPPDYDPREVEPNQYMEHSAEYRIMPGEWKTAVTAEFGTLLLEQGVRHIWDLDPAPANARELFFTIHSLSGRQGPWEFAIPLQ